MNELFTKTPEGAAVCMDCLDNESQQTLREMKEFVDNEGLQVTAQCCKTHEALQKFLKPTLGEVVDKLITIDDDYICLNMLDQIN